MAATRKRTHRAGSTEKVSISLNRSDLTTLRKRAQRLYGGNLSAVITEGVRRIREEEGREGVVAWLGDAAAATPKERERIRNEWQADPRRPKRHTA